MKSNAYLGCSIAISSLCLFSDNINSSNAIALVFLRKQNIFLHRKVSRRRSRVHYTKAHWYIIAKQLLHLGLTKTSHEKIAFFYDFCGGFPCFLVYFSLFWIKFWFICKIRVHNHVKNVCQRSLISATLCNFVFQRPTHS